MSKKNEKNDDDKCYCNTNNFSLDEGDCAIVVKNDRIQFLYNLNENVENLNEIQTATAGAVIALSNANWREKLIKLIIDDINLVDEIKDNEEKNWNFN